MRTFAGPIPALVLTIGLAASAGGCGFSDTLTSRGFIKEGDQICVDTLVKTGVGFRSRPGISPAEFDRALGAAYGGAAARFGRLDVRSDDRAMRKTIVARYSSFADRFGAAADAGGTGGQGRPIFSDITAFQKQLKAYGFDVCGGGGGSPASQER